VRDFLIPSVSLLHGSEREGEGEREREREREREKVRAV